MTASTALTSSVGAILRKAIADRVFPGAVIEVGRTGETIFTFSAGSQTYEPGSAPVSAHTIYDLASLTKVLATTALMADEVSSGRMRLNDRVRHWIDGWTGEERQVVTIRDLLEHASGLPGHRPYFRTRRGRASFEVAICEETLDYPPRTQSIYSDPGFMLLGFAMENAAGIPLDRQFDQWRDREVGVDAEIQYRPEAAWLARIAPTEDTEFGEQRRGEVHDENAAALGGVAAHAGLFGTAAAVGACARWWMRSPDLASFAIKTTVPGSSRALGWDTMLPTSSCGTQMSSCAIGHTGFTGTSLWIDPEQDLYVVILTNRVHPSREGEGIQGVRRALHDAIVTGLRDDAVPAATA
ncbi:MAG TPA: serine hydrolase domain-containing protein [Vicinamibacterales bacterium]|nr:serine hydrolase domain-containing protein [Vicinamibacterales bacterium]